MSSKDEDLERRVGRVTLHVLLSLLAAALWVIPLFVFLALLQLVGVVSSGIDARPVLLPLAVVAGFVTTWLMERRAADRS